MDEKKVRKSYKQLYEDALKENDVLKDKIANNTELINLNSELKNDIVIISSLENKIKDLEETISYLKPLVSKKDDIKTKEKYKGIKFRQGKFWHNGIGYYKISNIKGLDNG